MNKLPKSKRATILAMLCEGMSMRAATRVADVFRNAVDKLLQEDGAPCVDYQDRFLVNLPWQPIQCDEA